jgi:ketosteroid isomerase-like protein
MEITDAATEEIRAFLDGYCRAMSRKDLRAILAFFDAGATGFGSGIDEVVTSRKELEYQLRRDFAQCDTLRHTITDPVIRAWGGAAWVMAGSVLDITAGGLSLSTRYRLTLVLKNTGSRWLISHIHFSAPAAGQEAGKSYPVY